jgi:hypothetical protein
MIRRCELLGILYRFDKAFVRIAGIPSGDASSQAVT